VTSDPGTMLLAAQSIEVGKHPEAHFLGMTFNVDTLIETAIAGGVLIIAGLWMARRASAGKPTKLQIMFEMLADWVQVQVRDQMGVRAPLGVVQLSIALFAFILLANWLCIFEETLQPPTADVNLVYPLALLVIIWVNALSIKRKGLKGYFAHMGKPYPFLAPIEVITQYFARPLSLALRLWGNLFAGVLMIEVIALLSPYVLWLPNAGWKLFDMFIGAIQALIFALLTIIYFSEAAEGAEHEEEAAA
jgi:F-type H+-transporting ATPase subunit a